MGLCIRLAAPADAAAACEVLRRSITECCVADHGNQPAILNAWLGNKTPDTVAGWFTTPSNYSLVAEQDGRVVGVGLVTQAGKLSLCYVLPEARYTGAGKALLAGLEDKARCWGINVIRLHSTTTASAFYARNGYIHAGKEKSCYGVECDFYWKKLNIDAARAGQDNVRFCPCSSN